jgi:hypothetical protein
MTKPKVIEVIVISSVIIKPPKFALKVVEKNAIKMISEIKEIRI